MLFLSFLLCIWCYFWGDVTSDEMSFWRWCLFGSNWCHFGDDFTLEWCHFGCDSTLVLKLRLMWCYLEGDLFKWNADNGAQALPPPRESLTANFLFIPNLFWNLWKMTSCMPLTSSKFFGGAWKGLVSSMDMMSQGSQRSTWILLSWFCLCHFGVQDILKLMWLYWWCEFGGGTTL